MSTSNRPKVFTYDNEEYISIYEITVPFDYELIVNVSANTAEIMAQNNLNTYNQSVKSVKSAYIRLEDITADGMKPGKIGNYTVDMLEKLKRRLLSICIKVISIITLLGYLFMPVRS